MREVAELLNVDESRVSQLHKVALARLKANVDTLLRPRETEPSEASLLQLAAAGA